MAESVHEHPYYPLGLELPGYQPPTMPFERVLAIFFGGSGLVFLAVLLFTGAMVASPQGAIGCGR